MVSRKGRWGRGRKGSNGDSDCTCLILAGGSSPSLGRMEAPLPRHNRVLMEYVVSQVRYVAGDVLAVVGETQDVSDWPVDAVIHDDDGAPPGPLRGIVAGLRACRTRYAYVISYATPCIQRSLLASLRQVIGTRALAAIPVWENRPRPLLALYRTSVASFFENQLRLGMESPEPALDRLSYVRLDPSACRRADPDGLSFMKVHTARDLERLEAVVGSLS